MNEILECYLYLPRSIVQKRILVQLSVMLLLLSCGKSRFGVLAPELEPGEVDISLPTTETATVSNGFITIRFEFKGDMELESGEQPWNSEEVARFEEAGERWLEIVESAAGEPGLIIDVYVQVKPYEEGVGAASPYFDSLKNVRGYYFPTQGEMVVASEVYTEAYLEEFESQEDSDDEYKAIVLHELGHIFGIGTLWNLGSEDGEVYPEDENPDLRHWARESNEYGGYYYREPAALSGYREVFGNWDVVPISADIGHVYFGDDENPERYQGEERPFPSADMELMGDGNFATSITGGFLIDLGWRINRAALDEYPE